MKKLHFTTFVLLFSLSQMIAQDTEWPTKGDSEFGVIAGWSIAKYWGDDVDSDESEYKSGILVGVSFDYYLSETWSLKAILNYDQKGVKDSDDLKLSANYLTIPINANWHFGKRKRWFLNFGPYFGILMSANLEGIDFKDFLKSSDIGFNTGIGVKIPIGDNLDFFIESSGQTGFTSVDEDLDVKNSRGTFAVGIFF